MKLSSKVFIRYWFPVLVMLFLIGFESTDLMSGSHTSRIIGPLLHWLVPHIPNSTVEAFNHALRKTGHCVGYGLLTFLFFRALRGHHRALHQGYEGWLSSRLNNVPLVDAFSTLWRAQWAIVSWMATAMVATMDELHQMTIPSRTGTWRDVLLDSSAAFVAQVLIYLADRRTARKYGPPAHN